MTGSTLEQLRGLSDVVADTGDIDAIRQYQPQDATTNPSLLLKAAQLPQYADTLAEVVAASKSETLAQCSQRLAVAIGAEISAIVPGKVSTEVDARLSFDTEATLTSAREIIALYQAAGIDKSRILIKIAATWEGIRAAEILEREGIECNLTLLFSFAQAQACADAGATLISPFVGRIYDWYKARGEEPGSAAEDRGVLSVQRIYQYYKQHGYKTVVMGASFRNIGQIKALAGCDRLTISPALLAELDQEQAPLEAALRADGAHPSIEKTVLSEAAFRWAHNEDAMASEKLAEGIRAFAVDQEKLEALLHAARQA